MAKNKKGGFGKKTGRLRTAAAVAAVARAEKNAPTGRPFRRRDPGATALSEETPGNSMQDLARNTSNKAAHWDQGTRLRDQPVRFVSGGFVEPLETPKPDTAPQSNTETPVLSTPATESLEDVEDVAEDGNGSGDEAKLQISSIAPSAPADVLSEASNPPRPVVQIESIKSAAQDVAPEGPQHDVSDVASDSSEEVILFKGRGVPARHTSNEQYVPREHSQDPCRPPRPSIQRRASPDLSKLLAAASDEENDSDAALSDYIANMRLGGLQNSSAPTETNTRDLGNSDDDIVLGDSENQSDFSNSQDMSGDIGMANGKKSTSAKPSQPADNEGDEGGSDGSKSDEDIDDEQMARLLAKQEELGLGADELLLFDAGAAKSTKKKLRARSSGRPKGAKAKASWNQALLLAQDFTGDLRRHDGSYPSAEAMADAFEQLNMTGWPDDDDDDDDDLGLQLSDFELEVQLKASWQKDRLRKKEKKRAREELRAQGLLGKHANPNDPRVKYPNGMDMDDIKAEFGSFLLGSEPSMTFPPMDAHARKIIHEIAHRFKLTSKSAGSGDQRRPTLAKKKATLQYDEDHFQSVFARMRRRYIPRLDGGKAGGAGRGGRASGRGNASEAVVRHGEIVGGSAPEIGEANKGRTMLEKMGWSMGMALGAMDNKGMTQPIEHIVKRSKAGLG